MELGWSHFGIILQSQKITKNPKKIPRNTINFTEKYKKISDKYKISPINPKREIQKGSQKNIKKSQRITKHFAEKPTNFTEKYNNFHPEIQKAGTNDLTRTNATLLLNCSPCCAIFSFQVNVILNKIQNLGQMGNQTSKTRKESTMDISMQ